MVNRPAFIKEPTPDTRIWRYMNFAKFASLLVRGEVFFPQAVILEDPYEGFVWDLPPDESVQNEWTTILQYTVISCWHMSDYESAALWSQYATTTEGLAIQSTVERLHKSLKFRVSGQRYSGEVNYAPVESAFGKLAPDEPLSHPSSFFFKRKSFEHEKEYRVVFAVNLSHLERINEQRGLYVTISDLNLLIEKIYVAPKAREWFKELVETVAEKYAINAGVIQSDLYRTV